MRTKFFIFLLIFIFSASLTLFPFEESRAQVLDPFNFGGLDVSVLCPCSNTWLITIGPPKPGLFVYANTPQFRNGLLPASGIETLGLYVTGGGICLFPGAPYGCATPIDIPNEGVISIVGTG